MSHHFPIQELFPCYSFVFHRELLLSPSFALLEHPKSASFTRESTPTRTLAPCPCWPWTAIFFKLSQDIKTVKNICNYMNSSIIYAAYYMYIICILYAYYMHIICILYAYVNICRWFRWLYMYIFVTHLRRATRCLDISVQNVGVLGVEIFQP